MKTNLKYWQYHLGAGEKLHKKGTILESSQLLS
jgi:hypothetical protein